MSNSPARDTNRIPVTVQLEPDQIEWLESVAARQNVSIAQIVRNVIGICRNAAMSARRQHADEKASSPAATPSSSSAASEASSALDRLRKARSDIQRLSSEGPSTGAPDSESTGGETAGRPEDSSETSERPPSFFERVTSEASDLTDSPASGDR